MQIFSTGGTGTIGRQLPKSVRPLEIRVDQHFSLNDKVKNFEDSSIIHLAGIVGETKVKSLPESRKVNVEGSVNLAKQSYEAGLRKFVFVSTGHVYGRHEAAVTELTPVIPLSDYAKQKLEAEMRILEIYSKDPNRLVIARVFSLLDVGINDESLSGLAQKIIESQEETFIRNADDVRDFLDLHAVTRALLKLAISGTKFQTYNICSGRGLSIGEAMRMLLSSQKIDPTLVKDIFGQSALPLLIGDNSRVAREFPELNLTWKWLKTR